MLNINEVLYAFNKSGKRHMVITGEKGSGKSTFASMLFPNSSCGFITKAVKYDKVVMKNLSTGEEAVVGIYDGDLGKMKPLEGAFEAFGVNAISDAFNSDGFALFDEIGYLETDICEFTDAFEQFLDRKRSVVCVRREKTSFIERICLRDDVFVIDLETLKSGITLVIMASGLSRRFGENKLIYQLGDKKLIEYIMIATAGIFEKRVVITRTPEVKEICMEYGVAAVLHSLPRRSDTIHLGLEYSGESDGVMFCPSDQIFIERSSLMRLAEAFKNGKDKIYRLSYGENMGLPVVFPKKYFSELLSLEFGGGKTVIKNHIEDVINIKASSETELFDIDEKDDLKKVGL